MYYQIMVYQSSFLPRFCLGQLLLGIQCGLRSLAIIPEKKQKLLKVIDISCGINFQVMG